VPFNQTVWPRKRVAPISMYFHWLRILLIVFLFPLAVYFHIRGGWEASWPFYLGAIALVLIYLLLGTTRLAFQALQRGNIHEAERLLEQTRFPGLLLKPNKAQYYFTKGLIHLQQQEMEEGREAIQQALGIGLRRKKEKALAHLNLAHIHFVMGRPEDSRRELSLARNWEEDDLLLRERLDELEKALSDRPS